MPLETWIAFFFASCLISISPGSGALLAMSHGLSYGYKKTTATLLGLELGAMLILLIAGTGVGSLLIASELAFTVVKTVGAGYLIYLGWSQWRAPVASANADAPASASLCWKKRTLAGFFTNATNPKGVVFMVAVLPQFINQKTALMPQLGILALTLLIVDVIVMSGYALAASSLQRHFREARAIKAQNRVFGGILVTVGAALFFVRRGAQA